MSFSNDTNVQGVLKVNWDGNDDPKTINPTGLINARNRDIDLTIAQILDGISVGILSADRSLEMTLALYTDANNYSRASHIFPNGIDSNSPINYFFYFKKDFNVVKGTGAEFTNVGAIGMTLSGSKELDVKITFMETIKDPKRKLKVPEPTISFLSLVGITIVGNFCKKGRANGKNVLQK